VIKVGIDKLIGKTNSLFKLSILAGKRAQELSQGAGKLVEATPTEKLTTIALEEIAQDKVTFKISPKKE
jgi:DNA-directed RNA polymerase omega subunit